MYIYIYIAYIICIYIYTIYTYFYTERIPPQVTPPVYILYHQGLPQSPNSLMALQSVPNCRARDPCFHSLKKFTRSRDPWGAVVCLCVYLCICLFGCLVVWLVGCLVGCLFVCFLISPHFLWEFQNTILHNHFEILPWSILTHMYVLCTDRVSNEGASFVQNSQVSLIPSWSTRHENSTEAHLENVKEKLCPTSLKRQTNYHYHRIIAMKIPLLWNLSMSKSAKGILVKKCNQKELPASNTSSSSTMYAAKGEHFSSIPRCSHEAHMHGVQWCNRI